MNAGILLIRADAHVAIGTGHVMRCLALSQAWQDSGGRCIFALANVLPTLEQRLREEGMEVQHISADPGSDADAMETAHLATQAEADWIVVDGYHFGANYQSIIKSSGCRLLFLDDHGHSDHYYADVVLNQNPHARESLYVNREKPTQLLLGLRFAMLRREFESWRKLEREIPAIGRKILVTMGGSDPDDITSLVVEALKSVRLTGLEAVVVLGAGNPHADSVRSLAAQSGGAVRCLTNPSNMPELMAWADLALTSAGGTLWELLSMGCCVLCYARTPAQEQMISQLQQEGLVATLGIPEECNASRTAAAVAELANSPERRMRFSMLGRKLIDGHGATRVCEILIHNGRVRRNRGGGDPRPRKIKMKMDDSLLEAKE